MNRCVIYVRISKDRENETSTGTQEAQARTYAAQRGWDVVGVCVDPGRSAFKRRVKRQELEQALSMIENGQANILLVWKLDRFARSLTDFFDYWQRIERAHGQFASVVETFDTTKPLGKLMLMIVASFAEMESEMKRDRALPWNEHRKSNGDTPPGPRPYGYTRGHNTLAINPTEADVIKRAARRILDGASLRQTVIELQPASSRTRTDGTPIPMTNRGLRAVLTNPTTAGLRTLGETYVKGNWEPILARRTWDQLNDLFSDPERRTGESNGIRHLLSGIMKCGTCKGTMGIRKWKPANQDGAHRYVCTSCNANSIFEAPADKRIRSLIFNTIDQEAWNTLRTQGKGYDPAVIAAIEAEQLELAMMHQRKEITLAQFKIMNGTLNDQMANATGAEPLRLPDVADLHASWDALGVHDQRDILNVLFDAIVLEPSNGQRGPDRIFTRWAV